MSVKGDPTSSALLGTAVDGTLKAMSLSEKIGHEHLPELYDLLPKVLK
jgi:hypothetical protein